MASKIHPGPTAGLRNTTPALMNATLTPPSRGTTAWRAAAAAAERAVGCNPIMAAGCNPCSRTAIPCLQAATPCDQAAAPCTKARRCRGHRAAVGDGVGP